MIRGAAAKAHNIFLLGHSDRCHDLQRIPSHTGIKFSTRRAVKALVQVIGKARGCHAAPAGWASHRVYGKRVYRRPKGILGLSRLYLMHWGWDALLRLHIVLVSDIILAWGAKKSSDIKSSRLLPAPPSTILSTYGWTPEHVSVQP